MAGHAAKLRLAHPAIDRALAPVFPGTQLLLGVEPEPRMLHNGKVLPWRESLGSSSVKSHNLHRRVGVILL